MQHSSGSSTGRETLRNHLSFPLIANLVLIVVTVVVLLSAVSGFRETVRETTLAQSRFITTEWRVLRELKEETDQQLAAKDREIQRLRQRYLELVRQDAPAAERQRVEEQLQTAEEERNSILATRLDTSMELRDQGSGEAQEPREGREELEEGAAEGARQQEDSDLADALAALPAADSFTRQQRTLKKHIEELSSRLEGARRRAASAEAELTALREDYNELERQRAAYREEIAELNSRLEGARRRAASAEAELTALREDYNELERQRAAYREEIAQLRSELGRSQAERERLRAALAGARQEARSARAGISAAAGSLAGELPQSTAPASEGQLLDLVNTRALLRALVESPPIRAEYPELSQEMEDYFEAFGTVRELEGRREAYAAASRALESLAAEIGVQLQVAARRDSAEGYLRRATRLLERALAVGVAEE